MEFVDKIYIISLKRHTIRKEIISNDLDSAGFDTSKIEWIDAVNGADLDINECIKDGKIDSTFKDPFGILTKSIYGCAMSHNIAYERFLQTSEDVKTALILEDDAAITHTLLRLLLTQDFGYLTLEREINEINWDVLMLGGQEKRIECEQSFNLILQPVKRYPLCFAAHSYMITKNGAEKLLESNKKIQFAADVNLYAADVNLYCTPVNYFDQKTGALDKFTISKLGSQFEKFLFKYNNVGTENVSTTTFGDYYGDTESMLIANSVQVSRKLNVQSVDWNSFNLPNGDVIEDWANIHLKIENE